jgi:GTP cyclohydrolase II
MNKFINIKNFKQSTIVISQEAKLPTKFGNFKIVAFKELPANKEHSAIFTENFNKLEAPLVRIHSECLTGDTFGSLKCDCGDQLNYALKRIAEVGGILLYLRQEGRGIGLVNKINAYYLQDQGFNTIEANHQLGFEADLRNYDLADFILKYFEVDKIILLTNNPKKLSTLNEVKIVARESIIVGENIYNSDYLKVKKKDMGHLF